MQSDAVDHKSIVRFLYEIAQLPQPEVVSFNDPSLFKQAIDRGKEAQYTSVNSLITGAVMDRIARPVMLEVKKGLSSERYQLHMNQHWYPLQRMWHDGVRSLVGERYGIKPGTWSNHPDSSDYAWMHYIRSFEGLQLPSLTELYFSLLEPNGLTGSYLTKEEAYLLESPISLKVDADHRPHSEDGYAISFAESGVCAWKGLLVPERYIFEKESITKQDILSQRNVELRRALMEIIGPVRFSSLLDLETMDQSIDAQGNLQSLYRTKEKDNLIHAHLYFAHVVCPSTQRNYYLPVPPHLKSAQDAVAWTFGMDGDAYRPSIET